MMKDIKIHCDNKRELRVFKTKQYAIFRRMEGNRSVTSKRAGRIRESIESIGLIPVPIVVNEHMEIIDGQGRFEACKSLGLPIYYMVVPGLKLADCVSMNINSTQWSQKDYIDSYAETGNKNYQRLKRLIESYDLPSSTAVCAATGVMATANKQAIESGELKISEDFFWSVDAMLAYVDCFTKPMKDNGISNRAPVYKALCFCYQCDDVDNNRMLDQFTHHCRKLPSTTKMDEVLEALTDIYNFGRRKGRVYINTKYLEFQDSGHPWYANRWGKRNRKDGR